MNNVADIVHNVRHQVIRITVYISKQGRSDHIRTYARAYLKNLKNIYFLFVCL